MEKIDNLDKQILEIISQNARIPFKRLIISTSKFWKSFHRMPASLLKMWLQSAAFHALPFTNVCNV